MLNCCWQADGHHPRHAPAGAARPQNNPEAGPDLRAFFDF